MGRRVSRSRPHRPTLRRPLTLYRGVVYHRLFYLQLLKIVARKIARRRPRDGVFVCRTKHIGDVVNLFPVVERLSDLEPVEMATGPDPYSLLARNNPFVAALHAPFVYKRRRRAPARIIQRVLAPFYSRVILLDDVGLDRDWWTEGKHISALFAERCGVPPPERGRVYLSEQNRRDASQYLTRQGLREFVYVAQVIRHRRPLRSWPLTHYHALYRVLRGRFSCPIVVDAVGSDEAEMPTACTSLDRLDLLTAAAVIDRARVFIGIDSGLTHIAAALGVPTVSIHLGYPPECTGALGPNVTLVRQQQPFDDPAKISPEEVFEAVASAVR